MSMMEWIAVCGCGSGGSGSGGLAKEKFAEDKARMIEERKEIYNNAFLILQSGKGGTELNKVCADALTKTSDPSAITHRNPPGPEGWFGYIITYYTPAVLCKTRTYAVLVRDSGGNMHFAPRTAVTAYEFMKNIAAMAVSPNVAAIDVREGGGEQAFGAIIVGQRYGSLQEMTGIVTGAVIPQAEPVLPATLEPSSPELTHPLAQATVPTTSQQTVGGTTFSPWLLVGGAAAVVAGVALLRRNK